MTISDFRLRWAFVQDTLLHFLINNRKQLWKLPLKNISFSKTFTFLKSKVKGAFTVLLSPDTVKAFPLQESNLTVTWQTRNGTKILKTFRYCKDNGKVLIKFCLLVPTPCCHPLRDYWNSTAQSQQSFIQKGTDGNKVGSMSLGLLQLYRGFREISKRRTQGKRLVHLRPWWPKKCNASYDIHKLQPNAN